jgi:hypothetical protein
VGKVLAHEHCMSTSCSSSRSTTPPT